MKNSHAPKKRKKRTTTELKWRRFGVLLKLKPFKQPMLMSLNVHALTSSLWFHEKPYALSMISLSVCDPNILPVYIPKSPFQPRSYNQFSNHTIGFKKNHQRTARLFIVAFIRFSISIGRCETAHTRRFSVNLFSLFSCSALWLFFHLLFSIAHVFVCWDVNQVLWILVSVFGAEKVLKNKPHCRI